MGAIGGMILQGFAGGITAKVKPDRASPNQGVKLSLKNSLAVFLVTGLAFGLIATLIAALIGRPIVDNVLVASWAGVCLGLDRGGSVVIKHDSLRLILWLSGYTPLNFVTFLDQCARLILMNKVGGSYIFIHRMLLEYFAELPNRGTPGKPG